MRPDDQTDDRPGRTTLARRCAVIAGVAVLGLGAGVVTGSLPSVEAEAEVEPVAGDAAPVDAPSPSPSSSSDVATEKLVEANADEGPAPVRGEASVELGEAPVKGTYAVPDSVEGVDGVEPSGTPESAEPAPDPDPVTVQGPVQFKNAETGFCADLPGAGSVKAGALVSQGQCRSGVADNQMFELLRIDGQFAIRSVKAKLCFNFLGTGDVKARTRVAVDPCVAGDQENMMFRKEPRPNGFYLVHVKSGHCLDVSNHGKGNTVAGQSLTLYPCDPADDHVWTSL
ncbi:RICIN domain-containing protein [Kineosporia babensis]|uniref:RICIN domain-containing protein n=1 Tax=Kineosporia babensis TaxID=499548 RepID=A0A9X1NPR4_9ACTN|nr:RICIN domain-containing protein [Kineosporia babensis]MCD5317031.1 RICIN domain-containing protein [Kineosporia babensis]